jgi:sulfotransferase
MTDMFFVSGLPRSGSTLLVNLLAQHPDVFTTPTSGLCELLHGVKNGWHNIVEHRADKNAGDPKNLHRVLNSIFDSYHDTDKPVVIDKCRAWGSSIELVEHITGKKAKIIAPVRDLAEIAASFESLYRKGSHTYPAPANARSTEQRVMHWSSDTGEIGSAYTVLRDAFQRGLGDRICLVEYDFLTENPEKTMDIIWNFLGIKAPKHDFSKVINKTPEDDTIYQYKDLHTIREKVEPNPSKANQIIGENLVKIFNGYEFWKS